MAEYSSSECEEDSADEGYLMFDAFEKQGIAGLQKYVETRLNNWLYIIVNIAIIGRSGVGKSSFINAIFDLKADEDGAAHADCTEGTVEVKSYTHPSNKNIILWDLPGVGTDNFKREDYREKVSLEKYDFFIILSSERFLESDSWLAEEIGKMDKKFYFVRTKVDNDIRNEKKSKKEPRAMDAILIQIRFNCKKGLSKHGISDTSVYLIDNLQPRKFDFDKLQMNIINDAPHMKREALAFSFLSRSQFVISQKKKALEKRIQFISFFSGLCGAVPIPGFSAAVDIPLMMKEIELYKDQFGLTEDAIKKTAEMLDIPLKDLKRNLSRSVILGTCTARGLLTLCNAFLVSEVVETVTKYAIPIVGNFIAGALSYKSTSYCLNKILDELYTDSQKLNEKYTEYLSQATP